MILYSLESRSSWASGKILTIKVTSIKKETAKILKITFVERRNGVSATRTKTQTNFAIMMAANLKKQLRANKRLLSTLFAA